MIKKVVLLLALAFPSPGMAQNALLQSGPITRGHIPQYSNSGTGQPVVIDSGPAAGGMPGVNPSELGFQSPANPTGPLGSNFCDYDAPITSSTGYHYLCLTPNYNGSSGLIAYGFGGAASPQPLQFWVNGTFVTPGNMNTITVGGTAVNSGTTGYALYDHNGVLGDFILGSGVMTALGVNTGSAGAPVLYDGDLGTPTAGTMTNLSGTPVSIGLVNGTGLPIATGISGLGTGVAAALTIAPNSTGGLLTSPVSIATGVSGLGSGVATAIGNAVNAASGPVVTNSSNQIIGSSGPVNLAVSATAPTFTSGACVGAIGTTNGTAAFTFTTGTGSCGSTATIGMPTATTGWVCDAFDEAASGLGRLQESSDTVSSVVITNYSIGSSPAATNYAVSHTVKVKCVAY